MAHEQPPVGVFSPAIADALVDALLLVDDQFRVLYANRAVEQLLGWDVTNLLAVPVADLLPERLGASFLEHLGVVLRADPPRPGEAPSRSMFRRADGAEVPVDVGVYLVTPPDGPRMVALTLWDVSDRIDVDRYQRISDELLAFLAGASGSVEETVTEMLGVLAETMGFQFGTAWHWHRPTRRLRCEQIWRRDDATCPAMAEASLGATVQLGEGLAGRVADTDEPVWFERLDDDDPTAGRNAAIAADGLRSAFAFPIRTSRELVGVIELFTTDQRGADGPLVDAIGVVCVKLGEFLERVRLEGQQRDLVVQLERSQRQQEFLLRANRALAGASDFNDAIRRLAMVAVPALGDICLIDVLNSEGVLVRLAARHARVELQGLTEELRRHAPDIEGDHPAARAVRSGTSQWSTDMTEEFLRSTTQDDRHYDLTRLLRFHSYVSVPLKTDGPPIGALTVVTTDPDQRFENDELSLSESLAAQVAAVIERARAFDLQSNIAHILQNSLLPSELEYVSELDVAARYVPSTQLAEVGGDFYDVIDLGERRVALVIGDVEGHDMTAATVMGQLRSALRAFLQITEDPGRVLALVDEYVTRQRSSRLATACLMILDVGSGSLAYASAGHPPAFCISARGSAQRLALTPGPPLGIGASAFPVTQADLPPLATLILYTDGLIEEGSRRGRGAHRPAHRVRAGGPQPELRRTGRRGAGRGGPRPGRR